MWHTLDIALVRFSGFTERYPDRELQFKVPASIYRSISLMSHESCSQPDTEVMNQRWKAFCSYQAEVWPQLYSLSHTRTRQRDKRHHIDTVHTNIRPCIRGYHDLLNRADADQLRELVQAEWETAVDAGANNCRSRRKTHSRMKPHQKQRAAMTELYAVKVAVSRIARSRAVVVVQNEV